MTNVGNHEEHARDEVLARLLELNKDRAEEERRTGRAAAADEKKAKKVKRGQNKKDVRGQMIIGRKSDSE